jgi:hypothetical protein
VNAEYSISGSFTLLCLISLVTIRFMEKCVFNFLKCFYSSINVYRITLKMCATMHQSLDLLTAEHENSVPLNVHLLRQKRKTVSQCVTRF